MTSVVLVYEKVGDLARLWAVDGDVRMAEKIEEITGLPTTVTDLVSFDTFLSQQGRRNPFAGEA